MSSPSSLHLSDCITITPSGECLSSHVVSYTPKSKSPSSSASPPVSMTSSPSEPADKYAYGRLPEATVQKIVTEILPSSSGLTFAKDARDLLIECCVEFITLVSSEANEIAEKEAKKTIACEHVTKALEELEFADYVDGVNEVASEHKEQQKVSGPRRGSWGVRELMGGRRERRNSRSWSRADSRRRSCFDSRRSCLRGRG